jgi:TonB family protein
MMIEWLLIQTLLLSVFICVFMLSHRLLNQWLGAQNTYKLWLMIPFSLVLGLYQVLNPIEQQALQTSYLILANSAIQQLSYSFNLNQQAMIVGVWLTVAIGLMAMILLCHYRHISRLKRQPLSHLKSDIPIFSAMDNTGPQIVGVFRPQIVVPNNFCERFDKKQQDLIIAHELSHWRQGDTFWNLLALLILACFWFNPIFWLAYKHFRQQQELSCDAKVLAKKSMASRQQYALAMINVSSSTDTASFTQLYYGEKMNIKNRIASLVIHKPQRAYPALLAVLVGSAFLGASHFALAKDQAKTGEKLGAPIYRVDPIYPEQAAKDNVNGWVHLSFDIETDGSVSDVKIVKAEPKWTFETSAKEAVSQWKYQQGSRKLEDVEVMLNFELEAPDIAQKTYAAGLEVIDVNQDPLIK